MTDTPDCDACGSPYLAWQTQRRCVLWRCPRCGYIRRDLDLAPARARTAPLGGDPSGDRLRTEITARRIESVIGRNLGRVLDVGCGDGSLAVRLSRHATSVVGIDPRAPVERDLPRGVTLRRGTLEDLTRRDGPADLITAIHVLEHVTDLVASLSRLGELLGPGGRLYVITPWADSAALRAFGEDWWMLEDPTHVRFLSSASIPLLARRAGFSAARWRPLLADSLAVEAATLARRLRLPTPDGGAESSSLVIAAAAAGLPGTLLLRTLAPRWRASLEVVFSR